MTDQDKIDQLTRLLNGHDLSMWLTPTDFLAGTGVIVYRRDGREHYWFPTKEAAWHFYWTGVIDD